MNEYFLFKRKKDRRIDQIIQNECLSIGTIKYEARLGADVIFRKEKESNNWNFTLYKRIEGTVTEVPMIIAALVSIKRREQPWYSLTKLPIEVEIKNFLTEENIKHPKSIKIAEDVLYSLYNCIHYSFETDYSLDKGYLTMDDVRELTKYYQQFSMSMDMGFQFLASMAAIRKHGGDTSYFNDILIKMKRYELLMIIDLIVAITGKGYIDFSIIKKIFFHLYPELETITKRLNQISKELMEDKGRADLQYHVAISFAGEDRAIAKQIADGLTKSGYSIFYDEYERANLWGKDLYSHLTDVYSKRARYCLMVISENYAKKHWTNLEREAAQAKAFTQNKEYILPLRLDSTEIPGLNITVGYVEFNEIGIDQTISLLKQKLNE